MKRKLFYVIALLCITTSLNAQTLTWKNYRLRLHQLTADTIAVTDAYVQYLTVDTVIVQKYYYQQEIGIVDSSTYWVSSTNDTLKLSMDQLKLYAIELEDDNVRVASLDTLGYAYFKRVGINVDPTKRLSISDGTDTFHQDIASDKWTLYNDAGTPLAIITADSVGNLIVVGDLAVNGGDITTTGDLTITPVGDDVLLDAGLTVGSTTQAGDNNLRVEGTSALVGAVTVTGNILPAVAGTPNIGSTSAEFGHVYIGDDKNIYFGLDQDALIGYNSTADNVSFTGKNLNMNGYYTTGQQNIADLAAGKTAYWFNGTTNYISKADDANLDMGLSDFTLIATFKTNSIATQAGNERRLTSKTTGSNGYELILSSTQTFGLRINIDNDLYAGSAFTGNLADDKQHTVAAVADRSANVSFYVDGNNFANVDISGNVATNLDNTGGFYIGRPEPAAVGHFVGSMAKNYVFNLALTAAEIRALSSDAAVPAKYTGASQTELMPNAIDRNFTGGATAWANVDLNAFDETTDLTITATAAAQYCTCPVASAPTTIGKYYTMTFDVANIVATWTIKSFDGTQTIGTVSANGTNQSLSWTATTTGGYRIVAVATTSSADFDNFTLRHTGCVFQGEPDGINRLQWSDKSGNELHGTVSGAIIVNPQRELFIANQEASDAAGARESAIWFGGTQSGNEKTTLAKIEASHSGAADDEKGQLKFYVNDTNDANAPTLAMTLDETAKLTVVGDLVITGDDLFMATNTAGYILRADATNYNPVKFDDSADLAGFLDDETGTGLAVFGTSPTFTTQITAPLGIFTTSGIQLPNTKTAPGPLTGQMYYQGLNNADADTLFVYNGTAWKVFISL
uniref:Lectin/glucanase superfamily protein n=1 Tax=viral metagenome TaxID=1070528 RepID=A0A6M3IUM4_9ZZZZ